MIYNATSENEANIATNQFNYLIEAKKTFELKEVRNIRTNLQNKSRWLYLEMISEILNERGETFTPVGLKIEVPYNKDNLYENYWNILRNYMYPGKSNQLNTKEFCDLVEMILMMFSKSFQISIPFPNIKDFLHKQDIENETT